MKAKPKRPRPQQDRARQIHKAGCHVIRICGRPRERMSGLHAYGGGFHVAEYGAGGSIVIDIWPVKKDEFAPDGSSMYGPKVIGCELEPDGRIYLRSFRRGPWEAEFLAYAAILGFEDDPDAAPEAPGVPTGAGKTPAFPQH